MFYLQNIFDELAFGEFSQMAIGNAKSGSIEPDQYPKIVSLLNSGLTDLYTKFALRKLEFDLYQMAGVDTYYLRPKHVSTLIPGAEYLSGTSSTDAASGVVQNASGAWTFIGGSPTAGSSITWDTVIPIQGLILSIAVTTVGFDNDSEIYHYLEDGTKQYLPASGTTIIAQTVANSVDAEISFYAEAEAEGTIDVTSINTYPAGEVYLYDPEANLTNTYIVRLVQAFASDGTKVYINQNKYPDDLFLPEPDVIKIKERDIPEVFSIVYQATYPLITMGSDFNPRTYELNFPVYLKTALLAWIISKLFVGKTSNVQEGQQSVANTFMFRYEKECIKIEDRGLINKVVEEPEQFSNGGWA